MPQPASSHIPPNTSTVSAYLVVKNSVEAITFLEKAFGAHAATRLPGPDGTSTMHAEVKIGDCAIMLTDENPNWHMKSPETLGGSPVSLHLYVEDADAVFNQAVEAGATVVMPLDDAFWGDRYGKIKDPFGHEWGIATHKEDLTPEELAERAAAFFASMPPGS